MNKHPQTKTEYQKWIQKVEQIIREPLPDEPSESMGSIDEVVEKMALEDKLARPPILLPNWKYTNTVSKGLREFAFSVFCGPTGTGKTTWLANMAIELAIKEVPLFVASVETGDTDFVRKMLSIVGEFDAYGPDAPRKSKETAQQFPSIFANQRHIFSKYDSRIPHKRLLADILFAHHITGAKVALVDNLNFLLEVGGQGNQNQEMDAALHDMIVFCKRTPIHMIMVMHPRKTDSGRVDSEFDIKGSSTAVQEAANVWLWNRMKEDDYGIIPMGKTPKYVRELSFPKIRKQGRGVGTRVLFHIEGEGELLKECKII